MLKKYRSLSRLGRIFTTLSAVIFVMSLIVFAYNFQYALRMDPHGFGCNHDSMMMQLCHDPFMASIGWTMIFMGFAGGPLVVAWFIIGGVLLMSTLKARKVRKTRSGKK